MSFPASSTVTLPIGIDYEGSRYRVVHIDEMSGVDEEILSSKAAQNNGAKGMTTLLRRCIQGIEGLSEGVKRFDLIPAQYVRAMYGPDREFLLLAIRALSLEPVIEVEVGCPDCGEKSRKSVTIADLEVYELEVSEDPVITIDLETGFENDAGESCTKVTWRAVTGADQEQIGGLSSQRALTAGLVAGIESVEGLEAKPDFEAVRRLPSRDREIIRTAVVENMPGVDRHVEHTCEECGLEWSPEVDLSNFFTGGVKTKKVTPRGKRGQKLRKRA